jgi:hypothetical protein
VLTGIAETRLMISASNNRVKPLSGRAQGTLSVCEREPLTAAFARALDGSLGYVVMSQGSRASILLMG